MNFTVVDRRSENCSELKKSFELQITTVLDYIARVYSPIANNNVTMPNKDYIAGV